MPGSTEQVTSIGQLELHAYLEHSIPAIPYCCVSLPVSLKSDVYLMQMLLDVLHSAAEHRK